MKATRLDHTPIGGPARGRCGRRPFTAALLLTVALIGAAGSAIGSPGARVVVLVLPGATLADLTRADLPHLAELSHGSSGAGVAAWRSIEPVTGRTLRLIAPVHSDTRRPSGGAADIAALLRRARTALPATDLLWIDLAGLARASAPADRAAALRAMDELAGGLWGDPRVHDLWILAPPAHPGPGLAPFFWKRRGGTAGLLYSGSTHMDGVVTGDDVTATLAGLVGAPYSGGGCRVAAAPSPRGSATERKAADPVPALQRLGALTECADRVRATANRAVQWFLLLLAVGASAALRLGRRLPNPLALAPLLLPALLLLDGARRGGDGTAAVALLALIGVGVGGGWAATRGRGSEKTSTSTSHEQESEPAKAEAGLPSTLTVFVTRARDRARHLTGWESAAAMTLAACIVAVLAGDVFRWAVLGSSIRLGVRFYGIGNEYMGWCVGAALLAVGAPVGERSRPGAVGLLLAVALLLGHPSLGSKVGGGITAVAAAAVEAWPWLRRRRGGALVALAAALAGLFGLAAWDASRPPALRTHLGRLAVRVAAHGPLPFFLLAAGKLRTELRVTYSLWGVLLAAGLWLVIEARRRAPRAEATRAVSRLLPVAAVAFLCNDSGVIAAALMLSYATLAAGVRSGPDSQPHL